MTTFADRTMPGWHPLAEGIPPDWASEWGQDRYGVFVGFRLGDVTQRMRWIRPGRFLMGSPETELGRFEDEGPQHEVTISRGFWLFDAPCTQALWQAVMGTNPSRFKSPDRPVEMVSWYDCQEFLWRLNGKVRGLELCLPSEAQWEYACRAGSETATYAGPLEILGDRNAPGLDPIAWYGGNSGVEFDLEDGADSSGWKERQYPHERAGTRRVKEKKPNAWGLYDMLGNVWEWCADKGRRDYKSAVGPDPVGRHDASYGTMLRGGSWWEGACLVRSGYRWFWQPWNSNQDNIGFRCARGQK